MLHASRKADRKKPSRFATVLAHHLSSTGLSHSEVARRSGIAKAQISAWLHDDRRVGEEAIGRLAHAFAAEYAKLESGQGETTTRKRSGRRSAIVQSVNQTTPHPYRGPADLIAIITSMTDAAGIRLTDGHRDVVWRRISGAPAPRRLRVGWYEKRPLAYLDESGRLTGVAKRVTERVASLLGTAVDWVDLELSKSVDALLTGEVDMICCEYVGVESMRFELWFSKPLPRIMVAPIAIVRASSYSSAVQNGNVRHDKVLYRHTSTLIGQSLYSSLVFQSEPRWNYADFRVQVDPRSLPECFRDLVEGPEEVDDRVPCLVTDSFTYLESRQRGSAVKLLPYPPEPVPTFGLCFALHPEEGNRLGHMVDNALATLGQMNYFDAVAYPAWKSELNENQRLVAEIAGRGLAPIVP